jgi:hypothetical protein
MTDALRVPYTLIYPALGDSGLRPQLAITLRLGSASIEMNGLVDSGATLNVLPYRVGLALGAIWSDLLPDLQLAGNLGTKAAKGIMVEGVIGAFPPVEMVFAWTQSENAPLILGQVNFFKAFQICFFRIEGYFEIRPGHILS